MDHFRVARRGLGAETLQGLKDQHLATGLGQFASNRQADDSSADNDRINGFHANRKTKEVYFCLGTRPSR